jgi:CRP-like cAMP-binding protein
MAPTRKAKKHHTRDSRRITEAIGAGAMAVTFLKKQTVFTQGDAVGTVFYIQEGKVELTVVSRFWQKKQP